MTMVFFKTQPNLPDAEKARIEYHMQLISECIGIDRFKRPVRRMHSFPGLSEPRQSLKQIVDQVGEYLDHDVAGINVQVIPETLEKCGGGG